jgi:hypothetical protein
VPEISSCRICNRRLSNPSSVAVSMGPVCAKRFGVIFEEALAYARSIGAQLDVGRLQIHAAIAAQDAYRARISRRRNNETNPRNVPDDQTVQNVWSAARGRAENCDVEFSNEHHARVTSLSGNTYEVTDSSCTCPQFIHRLRQSGGACRHIEAYRLARLARANVEVAATPTEPTVTPTIASIVDQSRHEEALRSFATSDWTIDEEREAILEQWKRSRGFDGVMVHEDDDAWEDLRSRALQEWDYQYENVLGNTGNSFGMEIEFVVPRNVDRQAVAQALYDEGLLDRPSFSGYHGGASGPGFWRLETDSSITPHGLELVSPVLYDRPESWQQIERACNRLKEMGCSVNQSCGGHVHIGIAPLDHRTYSWQRLARIGLGYEKSIFRMGGADADGYRATGRAGVHRGARFTGPLPESAERIGRYDSPAMARSKMAQSRYTMFNTKNIDAHTRRKPAVEMRYPNSTLDHRQWQAQIQVANAIVHQAAVIRNGSPQNALTPGLRSYDDQLRLTDSCSEDVEVDYFRKFTDVLGNDRDRLAATWLFMRGRSN